MKISGKIILFIALIVSTLIGIQLLIAGNGIRATGREVTHIALNWKLEGDIHSLRGEFFRVFGQVSLIDGALVDERGERIGNEHDFVDQILDDYRITATIFARNGRDFIRSTTNIRVADGSRAVGTMLGTDSAAFSTVDRGETFYGEAYILGIPYLTVYDPIFDARGSVIGILYLGIPEDEIFQIIDDSANSNIILQVLSGLGLAVLAFIIAIGFSRSLSRPINSLREHALRLSMGDIILSDSEKSALSRLERRRDEIGSISAAFSRLLEYQAEKSTLARQISDKNLDVSLSLSSDKDELGKSFENMLEGLKHLIRVAGEASRNVHSGAEQVSIASQTLSEGATEQAASLEQISSATTEISAQARTNAESSGKASGLIDQTNTLVERGLDQMKSLRSLMTEINASAEEIKTVVKLIDDIAFQINLLALNANVEAARAGKYGKGFAVVADEVRNLANRSAEAVNTTGDMVAKAVGSIKKGNEASAETESRLNEIAGSIGKISAFLSEITASSREQADGISQISVGLDQIDSTTQSNTASAEQSAAASQELALQSSRLSAIIAEYRLDE